MCKLAFQSCHERADNMDDREIVDLYWDRNERAITETDMKYGNYCRSIVYHILYDQEDTEECMNDTYLGAWNSMPQNRPERLLPYLGKIARNLALDRYDYRKAKKRNSEFDVLLSELEDCLISDKGVEEEYEAKELIEYMNEFLRGLSQEKRMLFVRRYWFSDSIEELSGRFGISESKAKTTLFRIRKNLRKHLEKKGVYL